jgi:hypothetical protein
VLRSGRRFKRNSCRLAPSDVVSVYGAAGAALAVGRPAAIVLTNQKGAVLALTDHQIGLKGNADLSGLAI